MAHHSYSQRPHDRQVNYFGVPPPPTTPPPQLSFSAETNVQENEFGADNKWSGYRRITYPLTAANTQSSDTDAENELSVSQQWYACQPPPPTEPAPELAITGVIVWRIHPKSYYCLACELSFKNQEEADTHMKNRIHERALWWWNEKQDRKKRFYNGEFPEWISLNNDDKHCNACDKKCTDAHEASDHHKWKVILWQRRKEQGHSQLGSGSSSSTEIPALPLNFGNRNWFKFNERNWWWECRLCWKIATDEHMTCRMHKHRMRNPAHYLCQSENNGSEATLSLTNDASTNGVNANITICNEEPATIQSPISVLNNAETEDIVEVTTEDEEDNDWKIVLELFPRLKNARSIWL